MVACLSLGAFCYSVQTHFLATPYFCGVELSYDNIHPASVSFSCVMLWQYIYKPARLSCALTIATQSVWGWCVLWPYKYATCLVVLWQYIFNDSTCARLSCAVTIYILPMSGWIFLWQCICNQCAVELCCDNIYQPLYCGKLLTKHSWGY